MTTETEVHPVFVYGSCVARDSFEYFPNSYRVSQYVARHSLLADDTDASYKLPADLKLANVFQTRMLRADWGAGALNLLRRQASHFHLILWDIFDERHGVHWFSSGEVVTRSIDLVSSETAMSLIEPGTHVPFGADEHFEGWAEKATDLVQSFKEQGALERVRLLNAPWAEVNTEGHPTPVSMGVTATEANQKSQRYYAHLAALGVPTLEVPAELAIADPNHQWGEAPFHYVPAVYEYVRDALTD